MRIVIDVPPILFDRLSDAVSAGGYASIGQLATVALENQLSLESPASGKGPDSSKPRRRNQRSPGDTINSGYTTGLSLPSTRTPLPPTFETPPAASLDVDHYGWIWGIVNRVFPIKVAARSLLLDSKETPTALEVANGNAADRAEALARRLRQEYGREPPARDESLLTGLPTREPLYKAKERFAGHYFGRADASGQLWGALFELGLAAANTTGAGPAVALTSQGVTFAALRNPVLDDAQLQSALSEDEIESYVTLVASRIPRERSCFVTILGALAESEMSPEGLTDVTRRAVAARHTDAAVQTMKAGALGRLHDLQLITRVKTGRSVLFSLTQRGESVLGKLNSKAVPSRASARRGGR